MMDVAARTLPHGVVPFEGIKDVGVRKTVMCLNENIKALAAQLKSAQRAIKELQRRT